MPEVDSDQALQRIVDKESIREVLSRYCRGLDRMDKEMAYSVWWEGGTAFYDGIFEGTGHEFVDWIWESHGRMERHSHQITNVLIHFDSDGSGEFEHANSEAYVTVVLWTLPDADGRQIEIVGRGRYLDRWSKRSGAWAIEHRIHLLDMSTMLPLTRGDISAGSTRDETDLSFGFIPEA
jgi:hypothetical protein